MNNILNFKSKNKLMEFIKFIIVGTSATFIHYIIYFILQYANINYNISYTVGYCSSLIFNFLASNYFTFKTKPNKNTGFKFLLAHLFNFTLQFILLNLFIFIRINQNIAPIYVFIISVPINFILVRTALKKLYNYTVFFNAVHYISFSIQNMISY